MLGRTDTIAAIATAPGPAGIAIVRISGPESLLVADKIFRGSVLPSSCAGGRFLYGKIVYDNEVIDEAILLIFRAPRSYTREDVVEIQCHGGSTSGRRVLRAVLGSGARLAEPGEFTRRAFLNGRIDLVQAEAVADLIYAKTERASAAAMEQLSGRLTTVFQKCYDQMLSVLAELEASLDFPEDDLPPLDLKKIQSQLREVTQRMSDLLATWEEGVILREGALVVICGQTNAGKSTVFNRLLERNRSIVNALPGTTRDTIEEQVIWGGMPIRLVDTAGLRETNCSVEREGIERAQALIGEADVIAYVIDASVPLDNFDRVILEGFHDRRSIIVLNKRDLGIAVPKDFFAKFKCVECSALHGDGIESLRWMIIDTLGVSPEVPPHAVINERHRMLLSEAKKAVECCINALCAGSTDMIVVATSCLRSAIEHVGEVLGKTFTSDLLDSIFGRFCIGK